MPEIGEFINDVNTHLLLHMNGADGSTTFTDDSSSSHSVSANGNAQLDTAQFKWGTASGLFDGTGDYLQIATSSDWDFGSGDFTVECWARHDSRIVDPGANFSFLFARWKTGTRGFECSITDDGSTKMNFGYSTNGTNTFVNSSNALTINVDTWYHYAWVRNGNTLTFYFNGTSVGTVDLTGVTINNPGTAVWIAQHDDATANHNFQGWLDEFRISNGLARYTTNFVPQIGDGVIISDSITVSELFVELPDNVVITDSLIVTEPTVPLNESIIISDTLNVLFNQDADFATKIISFNPLIFITDTDPAEIFEVDITDPENPTWQGYTLTGFTNAQAIVRNEDTGFFYIACADGKVAQVNVNDLSDQTEINLSDVDNLLTIDSLIEFGLIHTGTENTVGELYLLDERSTNIIDTDFQVIVPQQVIVDSDFNVIESIKIESDFNVLSQQTFTMVTDFKCLDEVITSEPSFNPVTPIDSVTPINRNDFEVFVDSVELGDTDVDLSSIIINLFENKQSEAEFKLNRSHDNLNQTLEGNTVTITAHNTIRIDIKGTTVFTGEVSNIDAEYAETEQVLVTALGEKATKAKNEIIMSLPGLEERLNIYNILISNPNIYNPEVDPDNEDDPPIFKGIKVDLGTERIQSHSRFTIFDSLGGIATKITEGNFNFKQNWTYFWSPTVTKFGTIDLGQIAKTTFNYIGTSLSPVGEDLWSLNNAKHRRQRIYDDIENDLGDYEVGLAPFRTISVRNGRFKTKFKWIDENDSLVSVKEAAFDFEDFAKTVADIEYEKILTIHDNILPQTSAILTTTLDAYLYFGINILTRINIDNTIESNIYKNNNGFPVAVKSITIESDTLKVTLNTNNAKSIDELEELDAQIPDEDSDEFNDPEKRITIALKTDMNTRLRVK